MTKQIMTKRYVDIKELSVYTSLPTKTLYEWASIGKIPSIKIGSRVLFDLVDIDRLMAGLKRNYKQGEKIVKNIVEDVHNGAI